MRCPTATAARLVSAAAILAPGSTWAAGHGDPGAPIARVVDTRELAGLAISLVILGLFGRGVLRERAARNRGPG